MTVAQLTRHRCGPEFLARHPGRCRRCNGEIEVGEDYLVKVDPGAMTMHALCGREYCRVLDEHLPDDDYELGADGAGEET